MFSVMAVSQVTKNSQTEKVLEYSEIVSMVKNYEISELEEMGFSTEEINIFLNLKNANKKFDFIFCFKLFSTIVFIKVETMFTPSL